MRLGNAQTAVPRLLAMLCILAVFVPSFFMQGAAAGAVRAAVAGGRLLDDRVVHPVEHVRAGAVRLAAAASSRAPRACRRPQQTFPLANSVSGPFVQHLATRPSAVRWSDSFWRAGSSVPAYLVGCVVVMLRLGTAAGHGDFSRRSTPASSACGCAPPDGTHIDTTEQLALQSLDIVKEHVGRGERGHHAGLRRHDSAELSRSTRVYQWSRGPEEAILRVALKTGQRHQHRSHERDSARRSWPNAFPKLRFSFEPADIVSEVMSFGSPTPIEVAVRGGSLRRTATTCAQVEQELTSHSRAARPADRRSRSTIRPCNVQIDREKAGLSDVTVSQVARSVVAATSSSRFVVPNYWPDPKTGIGYQVQVEIPQPPDDEHGRPWSASRSQDR